MLGAVPDAVGGDGPAVAGRHQHLHRLARRDRGRPHRLAVGARRRRAVRRLPQLPRRPADDPRPRAPPRRRGPRGRRAARPGLRAAPTATTSSRGGCGPTTAGTAPTPCAASSSAARWPTGCCAADGRQHWHLPEERRRPREHGQPPGAERLHAQRAPARQRRHEHGPQPGDPRAVPRPRRRRARRRACPGAWKRPNGTPKALLVEALGDLLPREIVDRPKQGFVLPVEHWLRGRAARAGRRTRSVGPGRSAARSAPRSTARRSATSGSRFEDGEVQWMRPWALYVAKCWGERHLPL